MFKNSNGTTNTDAVWSYIDTMRLTQSYLRMEVNLSTAVTQYTFAVTTQQKTNPNNTELLLNLQDSFVVNEVGFFVGYPSSATDATFQLNTFANVVADADFASTQLWWTAGIFSLAINNEIIVPKWDLNRHFYIPQTQAATFIVGTTTGQSTSPMDQKRLAEDGFYPMEPNCLLIGSKNNVPTVNLPYAIPAIVAETAPRGIFIVRGVLAQNSTPVQ